MACRRRREARGVPGAPLARLADRAPGAPAPRRAARAGGHRELARGARGDAPAGAVTGEGWRESDALDCQCGARFPGRYRRDQVGALESERPCPGCGSAGRIYRAAIAGWAPPVPAEIPEPAPETPAREATETPRLSPPAREEKPSPARPSLTTPRPRAPVQGSLGL